MPDDKDTLPSDAEDSELKPKSPTDRKPPSPSPETEKTEEDPSEQPS